MSSWRIRYKPLSYYFHDINEFNLQYYIEQSNAKRGKKFILPQLRERARWIISKYFSNEKFNTLQMNHFIKLNDAENTFQTFKKAIRENIFLINSNKFYKEADEEKNDLCEDDFYQGYSSTDSDSDSFIFSDSDSD